MNKFLLSTALLALAASPAMANLQLTITNGTTTFTCSDGELSCDQSGGAKNVLTIDTNVGGFFVQTTLTQSTFGAHDVLQLSSSNIENLGSAEGTLTFIASDTGFSAPVSSIESSASLTFNSNIGAGLSTLDFFADHADGQGANPLNTPGTLLETVSGAATSDPDSFSGSRTTAFISGLPFSMTEDASLSLLAGGSITGFNQSMTSSAVPEPSTWAMLIAGFAALGFSGFWRNRISRKLGRLAI
jgi:hypothetical protein